MNIEAADKLYDTIESKSMLLAEFPGMGFPRPEFGQDIRSFVIGNYLIFYRSAGNGIEVLRVLHGSRDLPSFFQT